MHQLDFLSSGPAASAFFTHEMDWQLGTIFNYTNNKKNQNSQGKFKVSGPLKENTNKNIQLRKNNEVVKKIHRRWFDFGW